MPQHQTQALNGASGQKHGCTVLASIERTTVSDACAVTVLGFSMHLVPVPSNKVHNIWLVRDPVPDIQTAYLLASIRVIWSL